MFEQILELLNQANPNYTASYDEGKMMNIKADCLDRDSGFVYIEEFVQGSYKRERFIKNKTTKVQIYFGKFTELHIEAAEREAMRQAIETDIVIPFMDLYDNFAGADKPAEYRFVNAMGRFDANEVSIMIEFDVIIKRC